MDRVDETDHAACVDAWMKRAGKDALPAQLIPIFERGFGALWRRAHQTLGDVTLTAIMDRVLHNAAESYPVLAALKLEIAGLQCQALRETADSVEPEHLAEGVRFILIEFLTVIGNLTSDILSSSLHAELTRVGPDKKGQEPKVPPPSHRGPSRKVNKAKS